MKLALIPEYIYPVNRNRFIKLALYNDFSIKETFDRLPKNSKVYISDSIKIKELIRLLFYTNIEFYIHVLELYHISYKALLKEIYYKFRRTKKLKTFYNISVWAIKFFILHFLSRRKNSFLILSSELRKKFIENERSDIVNKLLVVPNYPTKDTIQEIPSHSKLSSSLSRNYFYLPGNIHNEKEFEELLTILESKKIDVIVTCKNRIILTKKHQNLIETGELDRQSIFKLIIESIGGIALFDQESLNQNLCASSKLYEFLLFGKPIIVSDVEETRYLRDTDLGNGKVRFKEEDITDWVNSSKDYRFHLYKNFLFEENLISF